MIDLEQSEPAMPTSSSQEGDAFARVYDFFKHMTGIVLVSIGGVIGLSKGEGASINPVAFGIIIGCLSAAGLVAVTMLWQLASMGFRGPEATAKLRRTALVAQSLVVVLLLFGLGVFMGVFAIALVK